MDKKQVACDINRRILVKSAFVIYLAKRLLFPPTVGLYPFSKHLSCVLRTRAIERLTILNDGPLIGWCQLPCILCLEFEIGPVFQPGHKSIPSCIVAVRTSVYDKAPGVTTYPNGSAGCLSALPSNWVLTVVFLTWV